MIHVIAVYVEVTATSCLLVANWAYPLPFFKKADSKCHYPNKRNQKDRESFEFHDISS